MSTDVELVRRWDADGCETGARRLFGLADDLDRAYEQLCRTESRLAGWEGPAAGRALPRIRGAARTTSRLAGLVRQAAAAIRTGLTGFAEAARLVASTAQSPAEAREAGAVAEEVDRRVAAGLADVVAGLGPDRAARSDPELPPPGGTPQEVARWWVALPPHLRRAALARAAEVLGRLAGLPAEARDAANRLLLAALLRRLRLERELLTGGRLLRIPPDLARLAAVRRMLAIAESTERTLAALARSGEPARLLTLDLAGTGRVAIGLGDLDRARHVAVVVPGMGQDAGHGVPTTVERARLLHGQAARESIESTAVLAWIGYAAPGWKEVSFATRARAGGRLLSEDLTALGAGRTAVGSDPPHVTVVGHSYGSTVAGAAVRSRPLLTDDLVLLGSPGVLADDVADLGLPGSRVYVGEARIDPVADLGAFGADPGDRGFGATRMRAEAGPGASWPDRLTGGHSSYFDPDSEALRNTARVVVGRGSEITRPTEEGR